MGANIKSAKAVSSREVGVRLKYILIAGDLATGTLLSRIAYWHKPSRMDASKLAIMRDGLMWMAKTREQWCDETGLTLNQYKRSIGILKNLGLIETRIMKLGGQPMTHIRLIEDALKTDTPVSSDADGSSQSDPLGHSRQAVSASSTRPFRPVPTKQ